MKDRVVQFPHRYQLVPVAGETNVYDFVPVPGVITEAGTPLNKANLLSGATADLYGLTGEDATVDRAFVTASSIVHSGKLSMAEATVGFDSVGYISFTQEIQDDFSVIDLSTSYTKFTIPSSLNGKLVRFFSKGRIGCTHEDATVRIDLHKNGTFTETLVDFDAPLANGLSGLFYSLPLQVATNDYFELKADGGRAGSSLFVVAGMIFGMEVIK